MDINSLPERAKKVEKETKTFFKSIKKNRHRELDDTIHAIHRRYSIQSIAWTAGIAAGHWDRASRTVISNVLHRHCVSNHMKLFNDICISMKIRSMYSVQCLVPSWEATIIAVFMRTVRKPAGNIRIRTGKSSTRYMH